MEAAVAAAVKTNRVMMSPIILMVTLSAILHRSFSNLVEQQRLLTLVIPHGPLVLLLRTP